jgi:hypothetical protein
MKRNSISSTLAGLTLAIAVGGARGARPST